jgi:glucokinase
MNTWQDLAVARYLGLDLGGTNIKIAVIEGAENSWKIITQDTVDTEAVQGPEHVVNRLAQLASKYISASAISIAGVGVAVPGIFDADLGTILLFPNLPGEWKNFQIRKPIQEAAKLPVGLINDARAFTLAESIMGAGKGKGNVACLVMGTGVGGGIVIDGKIHLGATGGAGEIAHQIVKADGPLCGCGNRGCVESLTSAAAFAALAGTASPEAAYAKAIAGDERALSAFQEVGKWIGIALANVNAIVAPDAFVIGGGVAQSGDLLLEIIREEFVRRNHLWPDQAVAIYPAFLGVFAGAIGAALNGAITAGAQLSLISTT